LRLVDNHALFQALQSGAQVQIVFIFDADILGRLADKQDKRIAFIWDQLARLQEEISPYQASIKTYFDTPLAAWQQIVKDFQPQQVFWNEDYEPAAIKRDQQISAFLEQQGIQAYSFKDQVIYNPQDILKADGSPYHVYTAYKNKWIAAYNESAAKTYPSEQYLDQLARGHYAIFSLEDIGFKKTHYWTAASDTFESVMEQYVQTRDYPAVQQGTSRIGVHLRFGTISIREVVHKASQVVENTFLKELIWREFFMMILFHYPATVNRSFYAKYDRINWLNREADFDKWCQGKTGYPLVDAGMRELNHTGFMHNRVRMLVASFLCKHLLIDWRWGEAYFAEKLLDYDQSANIGNWQWAAGCGTDAAPYFRVFSPSLQQKKFDPMGIYIRKWVEDFDELTYPSPLVAHDFARKRALETYNRALKT